METLNNRLEALLEERFPQAAAALVGGATFQEAGVDSMGVVEFIVTVERHFGLPMLDGNELSGTSTLDDARELLTSKGASA
ncbi:acyl carrier protein [Streptomyces sp. NPDC002536]|uniref:ACP n=1 Tax=Streptomyces sp. MA37 TaxID=1400207 RepID=A0A0U2J0R3_9ACTN|nr:ACP [Streptomyces sp. MA37]